MIDSSFVSIPSRALGASTCSKWKYGTGTLESVFGAPAEEVQVANWPEGQKIRKADKTFKVNGTLKGLYGEWLWPPGGKYLTITEGELDALSVSQAQENKWPVVSLPHGASGAVKAIKASLEYVESFGCVRLCFDMDEPGQKAAVEVAQLLSPGKAHIVRLPLKDASDMLVAGRTAELIDALWKAIPWRPDGILAGEQIWTEMWRQPTQAGTPYPHAGLTDLTMGARGGEVILVTAGTAAGKSTFCREVAAHWTTLGKKVGYVGLEEVSLRTGLGLLTCFLNRPLHLDEGRARNDPEVRKAFESLKDKLVLYNHLGVQGEGDVFAKMRYMAKAEGCTHLVLDHISILGIDAAGDDERKALDRIMRRLVSLANETGAAILAVSHLSNPEGKSHEDGARVTLKQMRGSGGIKQMAYDVIALERDQGDSTDVCDIRVLKCRNGKGIGHAGKMRYHHDTGRLLEEQAAF